MISVEVLVLPFTMIFSLHAVYMYQTKTLCPINMHNYASIKKMT